MTLTVNWSVMAGVEPEIDEGYAEVLERLREALRRDADREITLALVAVVRREYGYTPSEVQTQLGLDRGEMRAISLRLERAAKSLRAGL